MVVTERAHVAGHVAAAFFDLDLQLQPTATRQMRDHMIGVDHFDIVRKLDITRGDDAFAVLLQASASTSSRLCNLKTTPFRFNRMSTTSSRTPSSVEYSCTTPVICASVGA